MNKKAKSKLTAVEKKENFLANKRAKLQVKGMKVKLDVDSLTKSLPHLPTGSKVIDHLIGGIPNKYGVKPCPGIPRGRFTQVYGPKCCGKTTLALTTAAVTCANGGTVLYIDLENEFDPTYAAHLGVPIGDDTKFSLYAPKTLEDVLSLMVVATNMGVDLIVIDSLGAGVAKESSYKVRQNQNIEKRRMVGISIFWSKSLSILKPKIAKARTAVLGIGPTGGKAWEFFTSVRIRLSRLRLDQGNHYNSITNEVESDACVGEVIRAELQKSKVSLNQGHRKNFYLKHGYGIEDHPPTLANVG